MKLDALAKPEVDGRRFLLVDYLPTYAAALFCLILIWAGAPRGPLDFGTAWRTTADLSIGEILLIAIAITLGALLGHPLQLRIVRVLEGAWPAWLGPARALSLGVQARRGRRLAALEELPDDDVELTEARIQAAGQAGTRLRQTYPPPGLIRPTALGNVLAAMESRAGSTYGFDAVVAWPRLYPVLGEQMRNITDDRRDALDSAARLSATMALTAVLGVALLARSGWWLLLALIPLVIARLAYLGAVQAAVAYGESVQTAFDLYRFDLLGALHMPLPADPETERMGNMKLCDLWRQGIPASTGYLHPEPKAESASRDSSVPRP